jgi:hypothetical protein
MFGQNGKFDGAALVTGSSSIHTDHGNDRQRYLYLYLEMEWVTKSLWFRDTCTTCTVPRRIHILLQDGDFRIDYHAEAPIALISISSLGNKIGRWRLLGASLLNGAES